MKTAIDIRITYQIVNLVALATIRTMESGFRGTVIDERGNIIGLEWSHLSHVKNMVLAINDILSTAIEQYGPISYSIKATENSILFMVEG